MGKADRPAADLLDILTRLALRPADVGSSAAAVRGQQDLLLARVSALTAAVRDAPAGDDARLAARLLLADIGLVLAHLRGQATELAAALDEALGSLRSASRR